MRSQESLVHLETYRALGALPQPIAVTEVLPALQTGVVDGFDNTPLYTFAASWHLAIKHFTLSEHIYQPGAVLVSKKEFDKLPADLQKVLTADLDDITRKGRDGGARDGPAAGGELHQRQDPRLPAQRRRARGLRQGHPAGVYDKYVKAVPGGQAAAGRHHQVAGRGQVSAGPPPRRAATAGGAGHVSTRSWRAFERGLIVVLLAVMAGAVFLDALHRLFAAEEGRLERLLVALAPAAHRGRRPPRCWRRRCWRWSPSPSPTSRSRPGARRRGPGGALLLEAAAVTAGLALATRLLVLAAAQRPDLVAADGPVFHAVGRAGGRLAGRARAGAHRLRAGGQAVAGAACGARSSCWPG